LAPQVQEPLWSGFRGPDGNGLCPKATPPLTWNLKTGENVLWQTEIPLPGRSSPIVCGDRIFLTGATEETQAVYAIDRKSGAILWTKNLLPPKTGRGFALKDITVSDLNGWASPTPVSDGKSLFVHFASGDVAALDMTGRLLWQINLGKPGSAYGPSSSPLLFGNTLIMQYDQLDKEHNFVVALQKETGVIVWKQKRPFANSWASPILAKTPMGEQLVLAADPGLTAYDPATGKELWQAEGVGGEMGASPLFDGNLFFAANIGEALIAVKPDGTLAWKSDDTLPDTCSPLSDGRFLLTISGTTVTCLATADGKRLWSHDFESEFSASPVLARGNVVYLPSKKGQVPLFRLQETFEAMATNDLNEPVEASRAVVGDCLYLRGEKHLFALGTAAPQPSSSAITKQKSFVSSDLSPTGAIASKTSAPTDWTQVRGTPDLSGVAGGTLSDAPKKRWSRKVGKEATAPILVGQRIYLASSRESIQALSLDDGKPLWSHPLNGEEVNASPFYLDNRLFIGTGSGQFLALDAETGKTLWTFQAEKEIRSSANGLEGRVYFGSYDNHLYALDAATGKQLWAYENTDPIHATPTLVAGQLLYGGCDGNLHQLSLLDGKELKITALQSQNGTAVPVSEKVAFVTTMTAGVEAIDQETGKILWQVGAKGKENWGEMKVSPALCGGRLFVPGGDDILRALDTKTGRVLWTMPSQADYLTSPPVVQGERIFIGTSAGLCLMLNQSDGKELWRFEAGNTLETPALAGPHLVLTTSNGTVYCLE